jgi:hypothetical protein
MLRFKVLVSAVPLMVAALPTCIGLVSDLPPRIPVGDKTRILVKLKTFTAREAAPLIVGASSAHRHLASASF